MEFQKQGTPAAAAAKCGADEQISALGHSRRSVGYGSRPQKQRHFLYHPDLDTDPRWRSRLLEEVTFKKIELLFVLLARRVVRVLMRGRALATKDIASKVLPTGLSGVHTHRFVPCYIYRPESSSILAMITLLKTAMCLPRCLLTCVSRPVADVVCKKA